MASGNLSPRQRMINMMYLVLLALLALNVSREVLNAFDRMQEGMAININAITDRNDNYYTSFEEKLEKEGPQAKALYELALQAKDKSDELNGYIEELKELLVENSGGWKTLDDGTKYFKNRDNIDAASRLIAEGEHGKELKDKIITTREELLNIVALAINGDEEKGIQDDPRTLLSTFEHEITLNAAPPKVVKGDKPKNWQMFNFYHVPTSAAYTLLTSIQNDAKRAEEMVVEYLHNRVGVFIPKFDGLQAQVMAPSGYILQGKKYEAEIFLGAYNKTDQPTVYIGELSDVFTQREDGSYEKYIAKDENDIPLKPGFQTLDVKDGRAKFEAMGNSIGTRNYSGAIRILNQSRGEYEYYAFENSYQIGAPSATVSASKMNVFYVGVPNPVEIAVSGVKGENIQPRIDIGQLKKDEKGDYYVDLQKEHIGGEATISVMANAGSGMENISNKKFRVKMIPNPISTLGGTYRNGKQLTKKQFKAADGVVPLLENFDFNAKFTVLSFKMNLLQGGQTFSETNSGPLLTREMKNLVDASRPGNTLMFHEIRVVGPDQQTRIIDPMVFEMR